MARRTSGGAALLSIGELARFAGVTIRAVRHYHAVGLLREPHRDGSGYRRYDGRAVIDLTRIKALADAGVPLARVAELLDAEPDAFASALDEIDQELEQQVAAIEDNRRRIGELRAGESIGLPPEVVQLLERMRELGLSEWNIELEREGWLVVAAHSPDVIPALVDAKTATLDDPDVQAFYRAFDQSIEWKPDDPRLEQVVDMLAGLLDGADHSTDRRAMDVDFDPALMEFLDAQAMTVPAWRQIRRLLEDRGWTGWTSFTRNASAEGGGC